MRKWLAVLFGTAAVAVAGTALALTGPGPIEDPGTDSPKEVVTTVATQVDLIEFEANPDGLRGQDDVPDRQPVYEPPADVTPPGIEILHPANGQVFETKEVVLEGETEPGAKVFAGDHRAEVSESGGWRLVLQLERGENVITVRAIDAAGNVGTDSVTIFFTAPEPKKEEPRKEEPKKEEPRKEEPRHEEPKEEEPKEEEPKEEPHEWEFVAKQVYGECSENPPFDVFHGKGKPGSKIYIESAYGSGVAEVGEKGGWEIKVHFETAPVGEVFPVKVKDEFGNHVVFEFVHTG